MASAQVVLRGRFSPGTIVRLVRVAHEGVLRSEGGEEVGEAKVDKDGEVKFSAGVKENERYFVVGLIDGFPREVRITGRAADDPNSVVEQAPVRPDRVRLSDGSWADEAPERVKAGTRRSRRRRLSSRCRRGACKGPIRRAGTRIRTIRRRSCRTPISGR